MRYFLLLAVNLLFMSHSFAQKWEWARSYGNWVDQGGQGIAVDKNNNIYITGYNHFSTGGGPNPYGYWDQLLSKFDATGNLLWVDTVPGFIHARVRVDSEGNAYLFNEPMFNNGRIAKYDTHGNLLWVKQLSCNIISDVSIASNDDIVVTGYNNQGSDKSIGSFLVPNNYGYIAKADKDLNWNWLKTEELYGARSIAITGNYIYTAGGANGGQDSSCVRVFDHSGNCVKRTLKSKWGVDLLVVDDLGNYYVGGTYQDWWHQTMNNEALPNNYNQSGYIFKYNLNDSLLWSRIILQEVSLLRIRIGKDNSVFLTGNIAKTFEFETFILDKYNSVLYVMKLDSDGKLVWVKNSENLTAPTGLHGGFLYGNSGGGVCDMALNSAGDPIITGAMRGNVAFGEQELLANAGDWKDLLIAKIYQEPVQVNEKPVDEHYSFAIYPNPSGGIFNLQYHGKSSPIIVTVINQLGQLIMSKNFGTQDHLNEIVNLSSYSQGLYFIELASGESKEVQKIVIE